MKSFTRLMSIGAALLTASLALAQERASVALDIEAQPIRGALEKFADQTGLQVVLRDEDIQEGGVRSQKVNGTLPIEEALERLLSGTELRYEFINARMVRVWSGKVIGAGAVGVKLPGFMTLAQADVSPNVGQGLQSDSKKDIAEIIVTAQKRKERIQDVPFAITAVGQQEILDRGSIDIKALQYSVPGLNIQELRPGANRTTMRGINPGTGTGLPIVGIYVDEVGISVDQQQRDGIFPLVDIDRIEVLRGPQGTLYGQGSIAGTIRYVTRNPDLTKTDGFAEANVYDQDSGGMGYRFNGAIGVPLITDRAGLRISGGYDHIAGWIDYPAINIKDANDTERVFVRPKFYAQLTDQLTVSLLYQYYRQEWDTDEVNGDAVPNVRPVRTRLYPGEDRSHLVNAILSYDFGATTFLSSTGYQNRDLHFRAPSGALLNDSPATYKQFNQELRITSNGGGPFQFVAGVWYRKFESDANQILFDANGVATLIARVLGDNPVDSESEAVFGDVTYSASEKLDFSLGARYFWDERQSITAIPLFNARAQFHNFDPRGSIKYSWTPDASTYLTISKGFRSGGFNPTGTSFGPETLWNYEVGTKADLLGGALFIDVATYYLDYRDRQTQSIVPTAAAGVFLTETASNGKASGVGLEGSIGARLGTGFRLDMTAAYNDVKSDVTTIDTLKGERFGSVPSFTGSFSLSQRVPVGQLAGMWRLDYQHASSFSYIVRSAAASGIVTTSQDFHTRAQNYLNFRAGIETRQAGLYLDVQNLTNEDALVFPAALISTTHEGTRPRPRSYGVTLHWNF